MRLISSKLDSCHFTDWNREYRLEVVPHFGAQPRTFVRVYLFLSLMKAMPPMVKRPGHTFALDPYSPKIQYFINMLIMEDGVESSVKYMVRRSCPAQKLPSSTISITIL